MNINLLSNEYYYVGIVYFKHRDIKNIIGQKTYPMKSFKSVPGETDKHIIESHNNLRKHLYYDNISLFEGQNITEREVMENARIYKGQVNINDGIGSVARMGDTLHLFTNEFCEDVLHENVIKTSMKLENTKPYEQITTKFEG